MTPLPPSWRHEAAQAYLEGLRHCGLTLEVDGDQVFIPLGETEGEINLVRLLKPELLGLLREEGPAPGRAPPGSV